VNTTHRINLIPHYRRRERLLRLRKRRWMLATVAYAMFVMAGYFAWRIVWSADSYDQSAKLAYLHADIDTTNKSIAKTRAALREAGARLQANQTVTAQPDWSLLMALVGNLRGEDVVLNRCRLDASTAALNSPGAMKLVPTLGLHGYGRTSTAISQFVLKLENTQLFDAVSLLKTNREFYQGAEALAFQLECRLKTSAEVMPARIAPRQLAGIGEEQP
jgi:Tfp pilus assembly protein PilN